MAVLVFGATGRLGSVLSQVDGIIGVTRASCDLRRPSDIEEVIRRTAPTAVINAAAITDPDFATRNESLAFAVNATAPGVMAKTCGDLRIPFVHFSSDQVFDGALPMPYIPSDPINPQNAIGRTKAAGEVAVQQSDGANVILRLTFMVDGTDDFARLKLPETEDGVFVPQAARLAPVAVRDVAYAALVMAGVLVNAPERSGIYHLSGAEDLEISVFAQQLMQIRGHRRPLSVVDPKLMPFPDHLIGDRRLDCRTTKAVFGIERGDWRNAVHSTSYAKTA